MGHMKIQGEEDFEVMETEELLEEEDEDGLEDNFKGTLPNLTKLKKKTMNSSIEQRSFSPL